MSVQDTASRSKGMELFEITPVVVGGDPVNPENKVWVTRQQHFELVRYWNRAVSGQRKAAQSRE